jgi:hypothetical protein
MRNPLRPFYVTSVIAANFFQNSSTRCAKLNNAYCRDFSTLHRIRILSYTAANSPGAAAVWAIDRTRNQAAMTVVCDGVNGTAGAPGSLLAVDKLWGGMH